MEKGAVKKPEFLFRGYILVETVKFLLTVTPIVGRWLCSNATMLTKLVIPRPVFKLVVGISGVSIAGDCHTSDIGHWFAMTLT